MGVNAIVAIIVVLLTTRGLPEEGGR